MPAANNIPTRRESLNLRIKPAERDLIDRAAKARGKNRTEFVLEAARAAAEEALIEQRMLHYAKPCKHPRRGSKKNDSGPRATHGKASIHLFLLGSRNDG